MSSKFLAANKSAAVRFAMVHTHAGRLFNKAAAAKDADVIKIISDATKVPAPLIGLAAPRWTWFDEKGMPNVEFLRCAGRVLEQDQVGERDRHKGTAIRSIAGSRS